MEAKLIPLSDFVLQHLKPDNFGSSDVRKVINYTNLLKQPLTKEMFIGENRLFEGFVFYTFKDGDLTGYVKHNRTGEVYPFPNHRNITIEELISLDVELTPSALKQIGVKE